MFLFDSRTPMTQPGFYRDTHKEDLYTHERYNGFHVLLGFGDGEIHHIDMRRPDETSAHSVLH